MLSVGLRSGRAFRITDEQRSRHVHALGASGTGKSKFLEYLIRQDILAGRGLCLIDPHGTLADEIVRFCASRNIEKYRRVHVIEPGDSDWCVGFNPLRLAGDCDPTLRVGAMVTACAEVWGGEDIDKTPLLSTCLELVFYALAVQGLTLVEAIELTNAFDPQGIRDTLTKQLPDYVYEAYWADCRSLPRREFEERFSSLRRRLLRFAGAPMVRRMLGQTQRVLDLRKVMDNGEILIVNLATKDGLNETSAKLIGALLTSEFFLQAIGRPPEVARRHPYYLYIDECYDFLTGDIERMLDQTRKFGLHLVLAHHRLAQLRKRSESVYSGVMAGAQTKIVFGGLMDEDADIVAREIMRNSFNLERPKRSLNKAVVVGDELIWLEGHGSSEGVTEGSGSGQVSSWSKSSGTSSVAGKSYRAFENADPVLAGLLQSSGSSSGRGAGGGHSTNRFEAYSSSTSHTLHQAFRSRYEVLPTQVHTLEEEVHLAIVRLREQKNRNAIIKLRGEKAKGLSIPDVAPVIASNARIAAFRDAARTASEYITSASEVDTQMSVRRASLGVPGKEGPVSEADYWTEE